MLSSFDMSEQNGVLKKIELVGWCRKENRLWMISCFCFDSGDRK